MAHGLVVKPEAAPPAIHHAMAKVGSIEDRDAPVLLAAAKVAAIHGLCVRMSEERTPRNSSFAALAAKRLDALEALMALPANTITECNVKFDILLKVTPWMGHEDTQLFKYMVEYAQEVTDLFKDYVSNVPLYTEPPRATALQRSVRRFFGVAFSGIL